MLAKVFPIKLKPGMQAEAEAVVRDFAPKGRWPERVVTAGRRRVSAAIRRYL